MSEDDPLCSEGIICQKTNVDQDNQSNQSETNQNNDIRQDDLDAGGGAVENGQSTEYSLKPECIIIKKEYQECESIVKTEPTAKKKKPKSKKTNPKKTTPKKIDPLGSQETNKKKHKCTIEGCTASFSKNSKLVHHLRRHNGERPFICEVPGCTKSYTNSSHLLRHKRTFHLKEVKHYVCEYEGCKQILTSKWNLKKHCSRKHFSDKPAVFICSECLETFHRKRQLQEHIYIHTGVPPFQCDLCEATFTHYLEYSKHKRNHVMYYCSCKKEFTRWFRLLEHKRTCTNELTCKTCFKLFANKNNLRQHQKVHGEKTARFRCHFDNCDREYDYKKNLNYHIKVFHHKQEEVIKIPCTYEGCFKLFKAELYLRRHLQTQHYLAKEKVVKPRKPRVDKGKPRQSMVSLLSGTQLSLEENQAIIGGKTVNIPFEEFAQRACNQGAAVEFDEQELLPEKQPSSSQTNTEEGLEVRTSVEEEPKMATQDDNLSKNNEQQNHTAEEVPFSDHVLFNYCETTLEMIEDKLKVPEDNLEEDVITDEDLITDADISSNFERESIIKSERN